LRVIRSVVALRRPFAAVVAAVVGLAVVAPPASAAEPADATAAKPGIAASVDKAVRTVPRSALAQTAQTAPAEADTASGFFGTTKGKVALALFVGGAAWTIYSVKDSRDPVKSPIR
jgi:hypothetical protein